MAGNQARVASTLWVGDAPTDLVVDAGGAGLLVVCSGARELALVDTAALTVVARELITAPSGSGGTIVSTSVVTSLSLK